MKKINALKNGQIIELIRMMAWGDILMSTAVFAELKAQGYRIRYITSEPFAPALFNNPLVDELVSIPFQRGGNPLRRLKLQQTIQQHTQELEPATRRVWLSNSPNMSMLRGILNRVQFGLGDFKYPAIHHNLAHVFHEVGLQYHPNKIQIGLHLTPEEDAWGQQYQNAILVQTASSSINKDYPAEYWQELISMLEAKYHAPVYQLCKINQALPGFSLLPNESMRQAMAAVKHCKLLISLDSAFHHVAKAFNKPCVVLFGQTHPERFGYAENINLWCGQNWQRRFQPDLKQIQTQTAQVSPSMQKRGYHPYMLLNTPDVVLSNSEQICSADKTAAFEGTTTRIIR